MDLDLEILALFGAVDLDLGQGVAFRPVVDLAMGMELECELRLRQVWTFEVRV